MSNETNKDLEVQKDKNISSENSSELKSLLKSIDKKFDEKMNGIETRIKTMEDADPIVDKNISFTSKEVDKTSKEYIETVGKTFVDFIQNPLYQNTKLNQEVLQKAITTTSDPALQLFPSLSDFIVPSVGQYGSILKYATQKTWNGLAYQFPRTTATGTPSAVWITEGTQNTNRTKPSTTAIRMNLCKLEACVELSDYDLKGSAYDVMTYVNEEVAKQFAKTQEIEMLTGSGTGTSKFVGLYNDSGVNTYTQAKAGSLTGVAMNDLNGMIYSISPDLRNKNTGSPRFVFDRTHLQRIMNIPTTMTAPVLQYPMSVGLGQTVAGYEFEEVCDGILNSADTVTATGSPYFVFGDLSQFIVATNPNMNILIDPYSARDYGLLRIWFDIWVAIGIKQPKAFSLYKIQ
jgi:HK97 family phage major capsid protein